MQGKISLKDFKDMKTRYEAFIEKNNREPQWIATPQGTRVNLPTFKDMLDRYTEFLDENGREPEVIYMKKPDKNTGWVTTGYYKQDYQDTDHTCGPSSLQMALSALGCNAPESELARAAGTISSGTSHEGMRKAVEYAAKKCKKRISLQFKYFRETGWDGVIKHIKAGGEVVLHIVTRPGLDTDVQGRIIWKRAFGHYVYLVGVNKAKGQVRIADPTKGVVTFPIKGVEQAMRNWTGESLLLISTK